MLEELCVRRERLIQNIQHLKRTIKGIQKTRRDLKSIAALKINNITYMYCKS